MNKLICGALLILTAAGTLNRPAVGAQWPTHAVRFVVPFAAGGATDVLTRLMCDRLSPILGQPFIVENRGGAGANIGAGVVATSPPDGYTFLTTPPGPLAYNKVLYRHLSYDPDRDLRAVSLLASLPNVLVVNPSVPVHSVAELVAYAKANPGKLYYGSAGVGSTSHIAAELFKTMAKVDIQHVPYAGTALSLTDLLAGRIQLIIDNLPPIVPHIKNGDLRALAVSTSQRSPLLPDLPTMSESGLPGYNAYSWQMVAAPTGTPSAVTHRLAAAIKKVTQMPDFRARLAELGAVPVGDTPEEAQAFVKSESVKWRAIVIASGAHAD